MNFKNNGFLQQKIKRLKRSLGCRQAGRAEWVVGMFYLLFLMVVLCVQLETARHQAAGDYLEDALAASNLASAVIDYREYGRSHTVRIADFEEAYNRYLTAITGNLGLSSDGYPGQDGVIGGKVEIVNYTIYNVEGDMVVGWTKAEDGSGCAFAGSRSTMCAPNGQPIEHTSVYSEIAFEVRGLFGIQVQAHKGKLVDILATTPDLYSLEKNDEEKWE